METSARPKRAYFVGDSEEATVITRADTNIDRLRTLITCNLG